MQVKVKHPQHSNVMTFVDGVKIELKNHEGYADLDIAKKLIAGPFGYEWGGAVMPFNPETWSDEKKILTWNYIMPFYEGYGYVAQMMITGLAKIGIDVRVFYDSDYNYITPEALSSLYKDKRYDTWGIWHHFWMKPNQLPMEKMAIYTMWESTQLKKEWIDPLNSVNMILVPCDQEVDTFRENGVKVPIKVVEHGVDQSYYFYREKIKRDYFTFGTVGSLVARKNPELLIKAFLDEFGDSSDVLLYLKDTNENTELEAKYGQHKNIAFNGNKVTPMDMGNILSMMDLALFPSRGEGFGLGGLQAMGVGTACACTNWGGFKQYLNPEYNYALNYSLVDINEFPSNNTNYSGQWAEVDYEHIRHIMRHAFEHPEEVWEKGKKAAEWVKNEWTWERPARQLVQAINEYEQR